MLEGHIHPDFWGVAQTFSSIVERANGGGAAVCVYHQGERVVDLWGGFRNEAGKPWESDTLALSYSTTKGVASTLLHILADRDLLDYDEPVARYWPEFAQAGKEQITVRQLMGHQAGLYDIRSMISEATQMLDWRVMVDALAASPPVHTPGAAEGYHGLTYGWLVGELVQRHHRPVLLRGPAGRNCTAAWTRGLVLRAAGGSLRPACPSGRSGDPARWPALERAKRIGKFVNRGLAFARISVDLRNLAAALLPAGMEQLDFNSEELLRVSIPAANGMFDARSLARLYALLANGGDLRIVRIGNAAVRCAERR